jgi:kelch-like protein 12
VIEFFHVLPIKYKLCLYSKMKEKDLQVIELKGLSAKTMEILLDCIYSEKVSFNIDNVQEILPAAALLQLTGF